MNLTLTRQLAAVLALGFLLAAPPATGADATADACWACAMCYEDIPCASCASMSLNAIAGCCGAGGGDTYCVPDYGGFAVNCGAGGACQCDTEGTNCQALPLAGG